ncbi:MAG: YggS family pyridoxal phosphate-dependent enzyme [Proteobacteria bacterium]|nr:YggS family pyridoxal phosphate-dependent enzyme [Pseudomonadota bacterium]
MGIAENLEHLESRIRAACERSGRLREDVVLVGVSKLHTATTIVSALETTSLRDFGENYVQEYVAKRALLQERSEAIAWHFIGHLQRNKVRALVSAGPCLIHTIDSVDLALHLDRICGEICPEKPQPILVEMRIGDEESAKTGILPESLPSLIEALAHCRHLNWRGLMIVPPIGHAPESSRPYFRQTRALLTHLNENYHTGLNVLSYGMSDDFEVAIEEGATHIRIGTAIFGARDERQHSK